MQIIIIIISHEVKVGSETRNLRSGELYERASWTHLARLGLLALIPRKKINCLKWTYNVFISWIVSTMETQKAAEY